MIEEGWISDFIPRITILYMFHLFETFLPSPFFVIMAIGETHE